MADSYAHNKKIVILFCNFIVKFAKQKEKPANKRIYTYNRRFNDGVTATPHRVLCPQRRAAKKKKLIPQSILISLFFRNNNNNNIHRDNNNKNKRY